MGPWLVAALGVGLVAVGLTLLDVTAWFVDSGSETVVYSAGYAPVDDTVVMWSASPLVWLGLTVAGLLLVAALGGWVLGRRRVTGPTYR